MKTFNILIALILLPFIGYSQCGNGPTNLNQANITVDNITGNTGDVIVTANSIITENIGLFGTLVIKTVVGTTVSISNSGSTGLGFSQTVPSEGIGEPVGHLYHFFTSALSIDPSVLFPLNIPVNIGTLTINPGGNLASAEVVMTDLAPPTESSGTYLYYRTAIQVCSANGFEDNLIDPTSNIVLPINLKSFTASKFENVSSLLDWTTSSEINGSHFEIERSTNTKEWEKLGIVQAVGESTQLLNYEFIDRNVGTLRNSNTFYYRLKMVDNDGAFEYSDVRSVTFDQEGISIKAYPNPVTDILLVDVTSEDNSDTELLIFDNSGKILLKNKISSNGITEIDVNNVPSGVILMKVVKNNSVYTKKIIKVD